MLKNTKDLILLITVLLFGGFTAVVPLFFQKETQDTKAQYLAITTSCLTLVATAYQVSKKDDIT